MKVIKHGSTYIPNQEIKCDCCGCIYEIEDDDVVKQYQPYFRKWYYHVRCPECDDTKVISPEVEDV